MLSTGVYKSSCGLSSGELKINGFIIRSSNMDYNDVFENLSKEEVEKYNLKFPRLEKLRFPGQWD